MRAIPSRVAGLAALLAVAGCAPLGAVRDLRVEVAGLRELGDQRASQQAAADERRARQIAGVAEQVHGLDVRVATLEDRADRTDLSLVEQQERLGVHQQALADQARALARLGQKVMRVEGVVAWAGRFRVTVAASPDWQLLYANSTGQSQRVRIRRLSAASPARIRSQGIPRGVETAMAAGEPSPTATTQASWDFSAAGAQRWQRMACGQEIVANSDSAAVTFEILVQRDPQPVSCDDATG